MLRRPKPSKIGIVAPEEEEEEEIKCQLCHYFPFFCCSTVLSNITDYRLWTPFGFLNFLIRFWRIITLLPI
jgi:hypothetical protein